jgi:class 3 adenylate cyclase/tetratricopeptide (TPR) repeat protein
VTLITCPRCETRNQAVRRFCGQCGARLPRACPSCGFANAGGDRFCGGCGVALADAAPPVATAAPTAYTPDHLARKILGARGALEGERKQVTVLFADVKGSMELLADRDPEEARAILDPVLECMMEPVHRYEGTVNQVMGDGIMALFGAPVAHEDHAARACYAALLMQERVRRYADEVRRVHGVSVRIRVGLHSGEVVVRSIGSDLRMDYTAVGQTTHLAARMEQAAEPGTTLLTADTLRLVEGLVEVKRLGPIAVKGLTEPVEAFALTGVGTVRSRLQAAAARGLSRFVGRDAELRALAAAVERVRRGEGCAVAVIGEPGVGKSRLVHECMHGEATRDWLVLEGAAVAHGKATPYLPVIDVLRAYFRIEDGDGPERVREKVTRTMLGLDPALASSLTAVLALLDAADEDSGWHDLDPGQRRQQTLLALQRLSVRESRSRPLVVVLQDLQWVDSETEALLDALLEGLPSVRMLMVLTYRPEYRPPWPPRPHLAELVLEPLAPAGATALLDALLGPGVALTPLKRLLVERTQGNPFFIEESVRTLAELGALAGGPGAYRLVRALPDVQVPPTVHAVLAARIDRLAAEDKRLLQCAAVIGADVPLPLLLAVAEQPEDEVRQGLERLRDGGFLHEARLFPTVAYAFQHGLTHEVAYQSLLHERRRALHARIVHAIAETHADRLDEHVEALAHHALRAELWETALRHLRRAGRKAAARSAYREAVARFEEGLEAASHLPESPDVVGQSADLRLDLRNALFILGELPRMFGHLREAETLAERLGDRVRLGRISAASTNSLWAIGEARGALDAGQRTLDRAASLGDELLLAVGHQYVGQAYHALGEYEPAIAHLRRAVTTLEGDASRLTVGMVGPPGVFSRTWLVWCLAERGEFEEAQRRVAEALEIATASEQLYSLAQAHFAGGMLAMFHGDLHDAVAAFEHSRGLCEAGNLRLTQGMTEVTLGHAYSLVGDVPEALALLGRATAWCETAQFRYPHALGLVWMAEALAHAGRGDEARRKADEALRDARAMGARGLETRAMRVLGDALVATAGAGANDAVAAYEAAIGLSERLGMRPFAGRCRLDLGLLHARAGRREAAKTVIVQAIADFRSMGMKRWIERAERDLAMAVS